MTRSWVHVHRAAAVVLRSLVLIPHNHGNWRAQRDTKLSARLNFDSVLLVSWRGESALTGPSTSHPWLDIGFCKGHTWRTPVDNAPNGAAM
jgi:hypothetical protein